MITISWFALGVLLITAFLIGIAVTLKTHAVKNSRILCRHADQVLRNAETARRLLEAAIATGHIEIFLDPSEGAPRRMH